MCLAKIPLEGVGSTHRREQVETSILPDQEKYAFVALESSSELATKLEENLNQMFPVNLTKRRWKLPFN